MAGKRKGKDPKEVQQRKVAELEAGIERRRLKKEFMSVGTEEDRVEAAFGLFGDHGFSERLEKGGVKLHHDIVLIKKREDLYTGFYEILPASMGMIASEGQALGTLPSVGGMSEVMVVRNLFGPLEEESIRQNAGNEGAYAKFRGQPSLTGGEATASYKELWWEHGSFTFHCDQNILEKQGWFDALKAGDEDRLKKLWKESCEHLSWMRYYRAYGFDPSPWEERQRRQSSFPYYMDIRQDSISSFCEAAKKKLLRELGSAIVENEGSEFNLPEFLSKIKYVAEVTIDDPDGPATYHLGEEIKYTSLHSYLSASYKKKTGENKPGDRHKLTIITSDGAHFKIFINYNEIPVEVVSQNERPAYSLERDSAIRLNTETDSYILVPMKKNPPVDWLGKLIKAFKDSG